MIYVNDYSIRVVRSYVKFSYKKFSYKFSSPKIILLRKKAIYVQSLHINYAGYLSKCTDLVEVYFV